MRRPSMRPRPRRSSLLGRQSACAADTARMRLYYTFTSVGSRHRAIYDYTLSRGDAETTVARQLGQIGADGRLYGLDRNEDGKSPLCGLMKSVPSYDAVRARVIAAVTDAVEGKPIQKLSLQ